MLFTVMIIDERGSTQLIRHDNGGERTWSVNLIMPRVPTKKFFCIYDAFDDNFRIKHILRKYLMESWRLSSNEQCSFNYFSKASFVKRIDHQNKAFFSSLEIVVWMFIPLTMKILKSRLNLKYFYQFWNWVWFYKIFKGKWSVFVMINISPSNIFLIMLLPSIKVVRLLLAAVSIINGSILSTVTWELIPVLISIWRRVVGKVLVNISLSFKKFP